MLVTFTSRLKCFLFLWKFRSLSCFVGWSFVALSLFYANGLLSEWNRKFDAKMLNLSYELFDPWVNAKIIQESTIQMKKLINTKNKSLKALEMFRCAIKQSASRLVILIHSAYTIMGFKNLRGPTRLSNKYVAAFQVNRRAFMFCCQTSVLLFWAVLKYGKLLNEISSERAFQKKNFFPLQKYRT